MQHGSAWARSGSPSGARAGTQGALAQADYSDGRAVRQRFGSHVMMGFAYLVRADLVDTSAASKSMKPGRRRKSLWARWRVERSSAQSVSEWIMVSVCNTTTFGWLSVCNRLSKCVRCAHGQREMRRQGAWMRVVWRVGDHPCARKHVAVVTTRRGTGSSVPLPAPPHPLLWHAASQCTT
jgi:hypothetical protein